MGNWFSQSAPKDPDEILNFLLKGIFNNIDLMDMYAMTDPKRCAEYVIFGEKALDQFFVKMNLHPEKDAKGFIYFRKATTLRKVLGESSGHTANCKEIAWFFAKFLRTFAALFFSINKSSATYETIAQAALPGQTAYMKPTGQIFKERPGWRKWVGLGGSISALGNVKISVKNELTTDRILGLIVTKYFNPNDNAEHFILDNTSNPNLDKIVTIETKTIKCIENKRSLSPGIGIGRGSPTGAFSPIRQGSPVPPAVAPEEQLLFNVLTEQNAVTVDILYNDTTLTYMFGEFGFSFTMHITAQPNGQFTCTLGAFKWVNQPASIRGELNRIQVSFPLLMSQDGRQIYMPIQNRGGLLFNNALLAKCAEIQNRVYLSPNTTTSTYLASWKYIGESGEGGMSSNVALRNINPQDLYFDETTRGNDVVKITYLKRNVQTPNKRTITVYIECFVKIREMVTKTDNMFHYDVEIVQVRLKPGQSLDGLVTDPNIVARSNTFKSIAENIAPTNNKEDDVPSFIRKVADRIINQNGIAVDAPYRRSKAGDILRIPVTNSSSQYDLGKLQDTMLPGKSPFPACSALAAELANSLKTNPTTHVCDSKFRGRLKHSLPERGPALTTSRGILALSSLFITSVESDASKISESAEWKQFTEQMASMNAAQKQCKQDAPMEIDKSIVGQIQGVVQNLLQKQNSHNEAAFRILWELFDEEAAMKREGFKINGSLYEGGQRRLDDIGKMAIDLLTQYYIGCQTTYLEGVNMILDVQGNPLKEAGPVPQQENDEGEQENDEGERENEPQEQ